MGGNLYTKSYIMSCTEHYDNLDAGHHYKRVVSMNGKKLENKVGVPCEYGLYINGIEFFKKGNFYWLKIFTCWEKEVLLNNYIKINKNRKVVGGRFNGFGLTKKECNIKYQAGGAEDDFNDWIELIKEYLDSDDIERCIKYL